MANIDKEFFEEKLRITLSLEWLGVRFEEIKDIKEPDHLFSKTVYYFSVPESSTIEVQDKELNIKNKTSDGLISVTKELLIDMIIDSCKKEYPDDEEFVEDIKANISEYFKFYAKVRKGEIWTKELGDERLKELTREFQNASGYKEI